MRTREKVILVLFICVIVTTWAIAVVGVLFLVNPTTDPGAFGEAFGVVNALFSGLALCGLVYTLFLQLQETRQTARNQQRLRRGARMTALLGCLSAELSAVNATLESTYEQLAGVRGLKAKVGPEGVDPEVLAEEERLRARVVELEQQVEHIRGEIAQIKAEVAHRPDD